MEKINFLLIAVGLTLTSFSIVLARYPRSIFSRSSCGGCHRPLAWYELVPLVSYIFLKGHCRTCAWPIPKWMPVCEALGGLLFALAPFHTIPFLWGTIVLLLIGITACDLEYGKIPPLFLSLLGLLAMGSFYKHPECFISPLIIGPSLLGIQFCYHKYRGYVPLGMGDLKLLTLLAAWIQPPQLPGFFTSLGMTGLIFGLGWRQAEGKDSFPFAPCIALVFLVFFWQL